MKSMAVKIAGSEREPLDLTIKPGTSAADILAQLNLQGYVLSLKGSNNFFSNDEIVYSQVVDGDLLYAITRAEVGI
jgi:hypothetical protein